MLETKARRRTTRDPDKPRFNKVCRRIKSWVQAITQQSKRSKKKKGRRKEELEKRRELIQISLRAPSSSPPDLDLKPHFIDVLAGLGSRYYVYAIAKHIQISPHSSTG